MRRMMLRSTAQAAVNPFADAECVLGLQDFGFGNVPIVRVTRETNPATQDFSYSELINGSVASFVGSGNGFAQLLDHTGNGYHALQATLTKQPRIVESGVILLDNGNPTLRFDGIDDELDITIPTFAQPVSLLSVFRFLSSTSFRYLFSSSISNVRMQTSAFVNQMRLFAGQNLDVPCVFLNQNIVYAEYNGANSIGQANNNTPTIANIGNNIFSTTVRIGGVQGFSLNGNFNLQQFILFSSSQSANKDLLIQNTNNLYNIF